MKIEKQINGNKMALVLDGWLDTQAAPEFEAAREEIGSEITELVIDCSALEYISSSGIRQFVAAHKQMHGNLTLLNVSAEIMDVLSLTGLAKRMKIVQEG